MTSRKIDPRIKVTRRNFLQSSAAALPAGALVAGGATLGAESAWAQASTLTPHTMATLTLMARDIYPHDQIGDASYRKAVAHWDTDAAASPAKHSMINDGVAQLNAESKKRFKADYVKLPDEASRVTVLKAIEAHPFFKAVRADLVVSLYNQHDLWPKFGYEGASAQLGGYIHRGFNDIDWLPTA
ncbi:MAG: Twin-arginine translocation pathway signal [Rhodospirillales bacterium 20-60-12]|jgi:hypothetical protein|nr:MAG: Twin-arginine translocation pathway signal [Rhodospirillales bacterium 20-60-12]HQT66781.1 gluconate 2-dehydrogenase subunit 3 family protein [Acetobacteraceae bacterium]